MSRQTGKDLIDISFSTDEPFIEYQVRVVPATNSTISYGSLVESDTVSPRTSHDISITDEEFVDDGAASEGNNYLKVFAKDSAGNWST